MSLCAILPVANLLAANAALQAKGFGPGNFSVVSFTGGAATHAALHAWHDPAFVAAVKAIAGVVTDEGTGDPVARTKALIEAQGAQWGAQAPVLPDGPVTANTLYRYEDGLWRVIQPHYRSVYGGDPAQYPALIKRARQPGVAEPFVQPTGVHDAYRKPDPFTGVGELCLWGGKAYRTKIDANTWSPGGYPAGWEQV